MVLICVKLNYGTFKNYPLTLELREPIKIKDIIEYVERIIRSSDKSIEENDKLVSNIFYENLPGLPNVELKELSKELSKDKISDAISPQTTRLLVETKKISEKGQLKKKKSKKRKKSKGRSKGKGSKGKGSKSSRRKRKYKTIKRNK